MSQFAPFDRRRMLATGLGLGLAGSALPAIAAAKTAVAPQSEPTRHGIAASVFGIEGNAAADQSQKLQAAIDQTAAKGIPLHLPPGRIVVGNIVLRPGTRIVGVAGATRLSYAGGGSLLTAPQSAGIRLSGLTLDGLALPLDRKRTRALLSLIDGLDVSLTDLVVERSSGNGIALERIGGQVRDSSISGIAEAALFSVDARGLEITSNRISDCADNGILVWRSAVGADATLVSGNRIQRIANTSGGSGQYGNGINVYRAGNVVISGNMIEDCAYTAIRGNAANNIQMVANSAHRSGEVALYAEFGFEGALIASNVVDTAATGIAVTNFNEGGRLAVVQGNIVRNLVRREYEPVDKRGEGIGIEADAVVANNVIEGAPTAGILIGWGKYMRDVVATGNLIRKSRIGIAVTADPAAGHCLLANNMISGATDGAIRAMDHARPLAGDLALGKAPRNITLTGNITS